MFSSAERKIFTSFASVQNAFRSAVAKEMESEANTETQNTAKNTHTHSTEISNIEKGPLHTAIDRKGNKRVVVTTQSLDPHTNNPNVRVSESHNKLSNTFETVTIDGSYYTILKPPTQTPPRPPNLVHFSDNYQNVCICIYFMQKKLSVLQ